MKIEYEWRRHMKKSNISKRRTPVLIHDHVQQILPTDGLPVESLSSNSILEPKKQAILMGATSSHQALLSSLCKWVASGYVCS